MDNKTASINDKLLRLELAKARHSKHLTQKQVSKLSGLSESCISNIESGEDSSPTLRSLIKYTSAIGISLYIQYDES